MKHKYKQTLATTLLMIFGGSCANAAVTLLDSVNVGVTSSALITSNVVTATTNIDLNNGANFLAVVVSGEFNADSVTFGGQPMNRSSFRDQSFTQVNIYTLFNPNLTINQTLAVQADFEVTNAGYTLQYFSFSNVDSIGNTPNNGAANGATVNSDFASVTTGSYLLMTGADNNGTIGFSGATTLYTVSNGSGSGWDADTAGVTVLADSGSAIYSATSTARNAVAGLELIAVIPEPSASFLGILGSLMLLRRRRR